MQLAMVLAQVDEFGGYETPTSPMSGLFSGVLGLVWLAVFVIMIASMWKLFTKAGKPGWAAIVPIYNYMVMAEVGGKPAWWGVMLLIPCVGIVFAIMILLEFAKAFGKGGGYVVGMLLLPFIFFPMLAFGNSTYQGPAQPSSGPATA